MLLQNFADPSIRNTEGKTPLDLADPQAKLVLSGNVGVAVNILHEMMLTSHTLQGIIVKMICWNLLVSVTLKS